MLKWVSLAVARADSPANSKHASASALIGTLDRWISYSEGCRFCTGSLAKIINYALYSWRTASTIRYREFTSPILNLDDIPVRVGNVRMGHKPAVFAL